jgi:DNA replication and repair protein RecF
MFLRQLHLINFKNHQKKQILFDEKLVCITGLNGVGKTNILDAIYFACIGKSYFSSPDKHCMHSESSFFRIQAVVEDTETSRSVVVKLETGKKKRVEVDDIAVAKLADHVGRFPLVVVAPNDNVLILGGSEERRKYLDETLSQSDKEYLEALIQYQKLLGQRNALLKSSDSGGVNTSLLDIYDRQLAPLAAFIFENRKQFVQQIQPFFEEAYRKISKGREKISVEYKSQLADDTFLNLLKKNLSKDVILQRTTQGVHRDDVEFVMNGELVKSFGSQGQQKTFLLSLKIAQYEYLKSCLNKTPLFLIDDMFDKLDKERSRELLEIVAQSLHQVFITHTDRNEIDKIMEGKTYSIIEL